MRLRRRCTGAHAHGGDLRLKLSARPIGETHAGTVTVGDDAQGEQLILGEHGLYIAQQILAHVFVATETARGHDDGLAVVLLVLVGLKILDDDTGYRARLILDKLFGAAIEEEPGAGIDGLLTVALVNHRLVDVAVHAKSGRVIMIAANFGDKVVVVALVDFRETEVAGVVVLYRSLGCNFVMRANVEVPVGVCAGVLHEFRFSPKTCGLSVAHEVRA